MEKLRFARFCQPLPTERWGKSVPHGNRETGEGYQAQENQPGKLPAPFQGSRQIRSLRKLPVAPQERERCKIHRLSQGRSYRVFRKPAHGRRHLGLPGHLRFRQGLQRVQPRGLHQQGFTPWSSNYRCCPLWRRHGKHRAWRLHQRIAPLPGRSQILRPMGWCSL